MSLAPGSRIGPYEIVAPLGAGGMGEVFRARDTRLNRDVAIKMLPAAFSQNAERVARFRREAQVLASLNHPFIAAIHGLEESDGIVALALEFVEGEDLAERIRRGPIPLDDAIGMARQIAEGLESAHEKGIVHRDLKPANVKLTRDNTVKILDFGLARAYSDDAVSGIDSGFSQSPTSTRPMTEAGVILGTAAYMSPEQARGRRLDKRSDIWSFGIVFFEMLTGHRLFTGETVTDILASVLRAEPDWALLPAATPPPVRRLLARCLERDPALRLRDIGEARIALALPSAGAAVAETAPPSAARGPRTLPWVIALASLGVAALVTARLITLDPAPRPQLAHMEVGLPDMAELYTGLSAAPLAISPDGSLLAFVTAESGTRRVHLRPLDSLETRVVQGGITPLGIFFSPDGSQLGIIGTDRAIRLMNLRDGAISPRVRNAAYPGAAMLPDGRLIFVRDETLWITAVGEEEPTQLTTLDASKEERSHRWPVALPSGDTILFTVVSGVNRTDRIEALSLDTKKRIVVEPRGTLPLYVPPGYLLFGRDNGIVATSFDVESLKVTGEPVKILEHVSRSGMDVPIIAASARGHLVYLPSGATLRTLEWVAPDGEVTPLPLPPDSYTNPRVAPDGRRIAVTASAGIWIADPERGTITRLTASGDFAVWSPDGSQIYYRDDASMYRVPADGSGTPVAFSVEATNEYPSSVSRDGKYLASVRIVSMTGADLHVRPADGTGTSEQVLSSPAYEGAPEFSPDGRWLIYTSDDSGRTEVYIRPFPGPGRRWQISNEGGTHPRWNPDGRLIYYRQGQKMMAVDFQGGGDAPGLSRPRMLFERNYVYGGNLTIPNYDVDHDGSRLLMLKNQGSMTQLGVLLNWPELMRGR